MVVSIPTTEGEKTLYLLFCFLRPKQRKRWTTLFQLHTQTHFGWDQLYRQQEYNYDSALCHRAMETETLSSGKHVPNRCTEIQMPWWSCDRSSGYNFLGQHFWWILSPRDSKTSPNMSWPMPFIATQDSLNPLPIHLYVKSYNLPLQLQFQSQEIPICFNKTVFVNKAKM